MASPISTAELSSAGKSAAERRTSMSTTRPANTAPPSSISTTTWTPSSWTTKPIKQEVIYADRPAVEKSLRKLERLPPIVTPTEIIRLRKQLQDVALGKAFLLQGGDCAELFDYCEQDAIESKIKLLLQMSLVLIWGCHKPVVRIARMAGQFAKPRSSPTEMHEGREIPSFRGDILNGYDIAEREVDPKRLVDAYFHSAATSGYVRAAIGSGIADLHSPLDWGLGHVKDEELARKYAGIRDSITESLRFMKTVGADANGSGLETVDLYTSHEGLVLEYEQSLTRKLKHPAKYSEVLKSSATEPSQNGPGSAPPLSTSSSSSDSSTGWYNTSAHFLWIGDRTRQLDGGHVEFFRGIENPIGIKVGPSMTGPDLVTLLDIVNPRKLIGKVTLITRYGESKIASLLPTHIEAVASSGHVVVWQCDPMHGNTRSTSEGIKTRQFASILSEVASALRIHKRLNSVLGGVHLELTGEAVTECTGGSEGLTDEDLGMNYTSYCDPRLNEKQALELAFLVAGHYREG